MNITSDQTTSIAMADRMESDAKKRIMSKINSTMIVKPPSQAAYGNVVVAIPFLRSCGGLLK
jgi:hypothetical protein